MSDIATDDPYLCRRREAGAFLRSRRQRLTPVEVGLPDEGRRRTPGLRREEVAMLAGVGATWYTWLEQGREIRPSDEVLAALARVLRLDAAERSHLFVLHERQAPVLPVTGPERIDEALRRMLDSLTGQPALVLGRTWDVLAWNSAAVAIYGSYERLEGKARNALHMLFADEAHRRLLVDWKEIACGALAMFRADCAQCAGEPNFEHLIARLTAVSPEFVKLWQHREVARSVAARKRINHPSAGSMSFQYSSFGFNDASNRKLVVFTPNDEGTVTKLSKLLNKR